jgi:hypothetical protein
MTTMDEHSSLTTAPEFGEVEYDRDYWQRRALEAERRLEEHKRLEDEQAEVRRRGTELLEESRAAIERECTEWRTRAEIAEGKVAEYLAELEQKYNELDAELESWRRRAVAAEELVREQQPQAPPQQDVREQERFAPEQAVVPDTTPNTAPGPRPERPVARRPRGNWLG